MVSTPIMHSDKDMKSLLSQVSDTDVGKIWPDYDLTEVTHVSP